MLARLLLALLLVLVASPAWAAIAVVDAEQNYDEVDANTTVTTTSITVSGSNTYILCHAGARSTAITTVTSVQWDPGGSNQALTQITGGVNSFNTSELWGLKNPTAGTLSATATFDAAVGANGSMALTCVTFSGVDQTTPLGTAASQADGTDPMEVVVSSAVDEMVVAGVTGDCSAAYVSGDTSQKTVRTTENNHCHAVATAAGAASVTMDWTNTGGASFLKGVPLKPAAATTSVPRRRAFSW